MPTEQKDADTMDPISLDSQSYIQLSNPVAEREALNLLQSVSFSELTGERISELFERARISTPRTVITSGTTRDMLSVVGYLHRGELSQNKTGNERLSSKIFHAMEHESFSNCTVEAQNILKSWHERTGAFCPTPIVSVPIREIIDEESALIENSGTDLSHWTDADFQEKLTSTKKVLVGCGVCGELNEIKIASFRTAISYALKNRTLLSCKDCSVSTGRLEDAVVAYCSGLIDGMDFEDGEGPIFETQYRIPGLERMPCDGAFIFPNGMVSIVEVDGGYHWENRNAHALRKKIAADHVKTETTLLNSNSMLRIDERNFSQLTQQMKDALKLCARGKSPRYEVIGEECPGAALVSADLKG